MAFDAGGLPLGVAWQKNGAREKIETELTAREKKQQRCKTPIEDRQFETLARLLNCLAVYSIVAWKILYLCRLGRECPDLDCEIIFEPSEEKSVYMTVRNEDPPSTPPTLNEMIRMIATLGGYVNRRSTQLGPQTLWLGLQRVHDLSTAWDAFGPES